VLVPPLVRAAGGSVSVRDNQWRLYWWLERKVAPGVQYAQTAFEEALFSSVDPGCQWLDFGCGHELLPSWRAPQERRLASLPRRVVGLDRDRRALRRHRGISLRVCGDGTILPFADGQFDLVTANMVVEHLPVPQRQFREIHRVLKPGGKFVFHTPNANGYTTLPTRAVPDALRGLGARVLERRGGEDRFRTFYRANTKAAIGRLAQASGFSVDRVDLVRSSAMFAMIAPLAALELVLLRALASPWLSWLRPNLIAVLTKAK